MNAKEFLGKVNEFRLANHEYISNAVFTPVQLDCILQDSKTRTICNDDIQIILTEEKELFRLYFYGRNDSTLFLIQDLIPFTEKPIVVDIVGKESTVKTILSKLEKAGFDLYSKFIRMTCRQPCIITNSNIDDVILANEDEALQIWDMIREEFDPLFAHIPTKDEVIQAISREEITVVRKNNEIAGLSWFERKSAMSVTLRYFIVKKKYRGRRIGSRLLEQEFRNAKPQAIYMLWVGTYNSTRNLYENIGFHEDGVVDYILKYSKQEEKHNGYNY